MSAARMSLLALFVAGAGACSSTPPPGTGTSKSSIKLTITTKLDEGKPLQIVHGVYYTIVITGINDGSVWPDATSVSYEVTSGCSFSADSPEDTGESIVSGGQITVKVYPPTTPANCEVTARFTDFAAQNVESTVTLAWVVPAVQTIEFTCRARNIGAFVDLADFKVRCDVTARDTLQNVVPAADIKFITEAGAFVRGDDPGDGTPAPWLYAPHEGTRLPKDVPPLGDDANGEPRWTDANKPGCPQPCVRNPRDGLATLVAYVAGGADGSQGEPYVDANDNDQYDDGEQFVDLDGDGVWTDSQYDVIWKQLKVLWTGALSQKKTTISSDTQAPYVLGRGTATTTPTPKTITFTLLDDNLNVLAANSEGDSIIWSLPDGTAPGGTTPNPPQSAFVTNTYGISVDETRGYKIRNPSSKLSYLQGAQYSVTIENNRGLQDLDGPKNGTLTGSLNRTFYLDAYGFPGDSSENENTPGAQCRVQ